MTERTGKVRDGADRDASAALALDMEGVGVWTWTIASGACTWSPVMAELLGADPGSLPDRLDAALALLPPDERAEVEAALATAVSHPEGTIAVRPTRGGDGGPRWLRWTTRALRDDHGEPVQVVATAVDVTEQRRTEREAAERRTLDEIVRAISTRFINLPAADVARGIDEALAQVGTYMGANGGALWVAEDSDGRVVPVQRWRAAYAGPVNALGPLTMDALPWIAAQLSADEIVCIADVSALPPEAQRERAYLEREGYDSVLLAPLVDDDGLRAVVTFSGPRAHDWPLSPGPLLRALADACLTALRRKHVDEQRITSGSRQAALARLSAIAMSDVAPGELASAATRMVSDLLPAPLTKVVTLDDTALRVLGGHGWRSDLADAETASLDASQLLGYAVGRGEASVVIEDVRDETRFALSPLALDHGVRSAAVVRIGQPDALVGLLVAYDREPRRFEVGALHFLESVANLLGVGLTRRRAERQLREAHAVLSHLIESSPVIMFRGTPDRRTLDYVSPNVEDILGLAPDEVAHRWWDLMSPDDRGTAMAVLDRVRTQGAGEYEARFRRQDGTQVTLRVVLRLDGNGNGTAAGRELAGYAMDVTERHAAEQRLRRAEKLEAVGQLAGGVAHDFNNLLMVIQGYVEVVAARVDASELTEVLAAVEHAQLLIDQLLTFSRRRAPTETVVDVSALACGVVSMVDRLIGPDVHVEVALAEGLPPVLADEARLEQALVNLLLNARDAMPGGGTVTLSTDLARAGDLPEDLGGPHVCVRVADDGEGMTREVRAHAFEPFFTTKGEGQGTGLGLPTVYGAVTASGGHIELETEPGVGTTFSLFLPVAETPLDETRAAPAAVEGDGGDGRLVLVVEDQQQIRELISGVLERAGYRVLSGADGEHAQRLAAQHPELELLVTDVSMPGLKGPDLAAALRRSHPTLRVLYMSGYSAGALVGDVRFLQKPFSLSELRTAVQAALD